MADMKVGLRGLKKDIHSEYLKGSYLVGHLVGQMGGWSVAPSVGLTGR